MGIEKDPGSTVFHRQLWDLPAAHLESILIFFIAKDIKGSDDDQADVFQLIKITFSRFQEPAVHKALIKTAAPWKVPGVFFLDFHIIDRIIDILRPDVYPDVTVEGRLLLLLLRLGKIFQENILPQDNLQDDLEVSGIFDSLREKKTV